MSKYAIDCEMVGSGNRSLLARVSIVNQHGRVIMDKYVKPTAVVTDYRDFVSGIRKRDLDNGFDFYAVRNEVANYLRGCILVGHSLKYDLDALNLPHPEKDQRDLARFPPLVSTYYLSNIYFIVCITM